jgi:DNA-binding transcriptional ArsR family regulator
MSLGDAPERRQASLRAMAHPVRLRMLSLLTGASLTAADIARELGLTHANASYHLRNLRTAGLIVQAGEERIRGGVAKRYRYDAERNREATRAVVTELVRRTAAAGGSMIDTELWVDPEVFREIRDRISQAIRDLHAAAQAPHTPRTVRTSTTIAMLRMAES